MYSIELGYYYVSVYIANENYKLLEQDGIH